MCTLVWQASFTTAGIPEGSLEGLAGPHTCSEACQTLSAPGWVHVPSAPHPRPGHQPGRLQVPVQTLMAVPSSSQHTCLEACLTLRAHLHGAMHCVALRAGPGCLQGSTSPPAPAQAAALPVSVPLGVKDRPNLLKPPLLMLLWPAWPSACGCLMCCPERTVQTNNLAPG